MKDLSMHILDIVQNSTRAGARLVEIRVTESILKNQLIIEINDDGCGMDKEMVKQVSDPFFTTRTTRKVGMGIPLLIQNAELTGGHVEINSILGKGTSLKAIFTQNHIDRVPWGDIGGTIALIISGNPDIDFVYTHSYNHENFEISSKVIKQELEGLPVNNPEVIRFMKDMIIENLQEMGVSLS